jgi:hypothetical protein
MLIALLIALGVDLAVVVVFAVFLFGRRRWLKRQPRRTRRGDPGVGRRGRWPEPEMEAGSGRWVRDVLVWSKAPFMFRNELIPVDRLCGEQPVHAGVKRLGDKPVVIEFASGAARIEVAAKAGHRDLVTGLLSVDVT